MMGPCWLSLVPRRGQPTSLAAVVLWGGGLQQGPAHSDGTQAVGQWGLAISSVSGFGLLTSSSVLQVAAFDGLVIQHWDTWRGTFLSLSHDAMAEHQAEQHQRMLHIQVCVVSADDQHLLGLGPLVREQMTWLRFQFKLVVETSNASELRIIVAIDRSQRCVFALSYSHQHIADNNRRS